MNKLNIPSGQSQNEYFADFIVKLTAKFKPLQIFCFGKIAESTNKEGCFTDILTDDSYQYFLLMVTDSLTRIEHEAQDFANSHYLFGKVNLLVHGKETITEAIKANSRFFITINNKAKLVYSKDGMLQSVPAVGYIPAQAPLKSRKLYDHRMELASGFMDSAKECQNKQLYHLSVFMLHQSVEQCCNALIRVYLGYRCDIHNLQRQLSLCNSFSLAPSRLFFCGRADDKRLFEIMVKSYSAARYKDNFSVEQADAEQLLFRVAAFLELTAQLCLTKIDTLAIEAELYKQAKTDSEVYNV